MGNFEASCPYRGKCTGEIVKFRQMKGIVPNWALSRYGHPEVVFQFIDDQGNASEPIRFGEELLTTDEAEEFVRGCTGPPKHFRILGELGLQRNCCRVDGGVFGHKTRPATLAQYDHVEMHQEWDFRPLPVEE